MDQLFYFLGKKGNFMGFKSEGLFQSTPKIRNCKIYRQVYRCVRIYMKEVKAKTGWMGINIVVNTDLKYISNLL